MAGLVPAIHVFRSVVKEDVDARDKRGHDEVKLMPPPVADIGVLRRDHAPAAVDLANDAGADALA